MATGAESLSNTGGQPTRPPIVPVCVNGEDAGRVYVNGTTLGIDLNQNCSGMDIGSEKSTPSTPDGGGGKGEPSISSQSSEEKEVTFGLGDTSTSTDGAGDSENKTSSETELELAKPTEEELLKQLEAANRMLEADEKSCSALATLSTTTPGHSRKGSGSSIVSSTSSNSFYSAQNSNECEDNVNNEPHRMPSPEPTASQKRIFLKALNKNRKKLLTEKRNSVPNLILKHNPCYHPMELCLPGTLSKIGQPPVLHLSPSAVSHDAPDQVPELDKMALGSPSETLWEIWGGIINDWEPVKKKPVFLRELVRKGIPLEFRGMAWQLILGVHDSQHKQEYADHMKKTSPCEKLIRRDIARTFPDHDFFKEKDGCGQESLFNVMKAYSLHDREVGYCQGSGFIVGLLLMQMPEEDAYAVLVRLMQDFRLRELFKPSMAELGLCMYKLECLLQELLPILLVHFQTQNFDTSMYASSWFLTLYVTALPLSLARRIMDLFVSEGMEMIFRVGVAILQSCQEDLLALDMEGLLKYLQKDLKSRFQQDQDQDNLLQTAYGIKYSHKKMKKLEKEYTALKTKENEDQIELRRLRTENRLLRQRIDNLEKVEAKLLRKNEESATLADKLVQDQVTWAQEVEVLYATRNDLSITQLQLQETEKKLFAAEDIIGDIRKRTRIIEDAVHLDESEERNMVKYLQEELIAVRLREAETAGLIKELRRKISDLEDTNLRLQRSPSNDVQQLQEELIAVKLREAEANLSLKELRMKVNEIESYWEAHMERACQSSPKLKGAKSEVRQLQEDVMTLKLKEAWAVSDVKETKQKLMEFETQNQICTNQIRRMGEDNKDLKQQIAESSEREKDLKTNIKHLMRKLDDTESKRKEEAMMARIRDAESVQHLADLRHKVAEIDIQKDELLVAGQFDVKANNQELENKLHDLQDEILQLQLASSPKHIGRSMMSDSFMGDNSDEEVDAEIKDSANLDRTLSEIIEGKSELTSFLWVGSGDNENPPATTPANSDGDTVDLIKAEHSNEGPVKKGEHSGHVQMTGDTAAVASPDSTTTMMSTSPLVVATTTVATSAIPCGSTDIMNSADPFRGESNVIPPCDDSSETTDTASGNSDYKGKNLPPPLTTGHQKYRKKTDENSHKTQSQNNFGNQSMQYGDETDSALVEGSCFDPNFPASWELYEEVVEVDQNNESRLIGRILSEHDMLVGRFSQTRNSASSEDSVKAAEGEIPDVEVIYDPSWRGSSLVREIEKEGNDESLILKESTV